VDPQKVHSAKDSSLADTLIIDASPFLAAPQQRVKITSDIRSLSIDAGSGERN
jgi:hypothetical protein